METEGVRTLCLHYKALRVKRTHIWNIGSYVRNRKYGLGWITSIWLLGPLGLLLAGMESKIQA